jgi:hypothetical protein
MTDDKDGGSGSGSGGSAGAEVFWEEANRFLEAFLTADEQAEPLFKVCSD